MGAVKVIINKELKVAFNSLLIYIAYTAFLCVTGFVCWFSGKNIFSSGQASLSNLLDALFPNTGTHDEKYFRRTQGRNL